MGSGGSKPTESKANDEQKNDEQKKDPKLPVQEADDVVSRPDSPDDETPDHGNDLPPSVTKLRALRPSKEFPTPERLRLANNEYAKLNNPVPKDKVGNVLPFPTPATKEEIIGRDGFGSIDRHAVAAEAGLMFKPMQELVDYLVKPARNDLQKVRAIFRWIGVNQDVPEVADLVKLASLAGGYRLPVYPLVRIQLGVGSLGDLFLHMCSLAGVPGRRVHGYCKGTVSYSPGDDLTDFPMAWEAVLVDGRWVFVICNWCLTGVIGGGQGDWELVDDDGQGGVGGGGGGGPMMHITSFDERYFLVDPAQMIYYCFPKDEPRLQLLGRPVTFREYTDMAQLEPAFFQLGLRLLPGGLKVMVHAHQGEAHVEFGLPPDAKRDFKYRFWRSRQNTKAEAEEEGDHMKRYVFMQQKDGRLSCRITLPSKGKYKFDVLGRAVGQQDSHGLVATYLILADSGARKARAMPENARDEWGPGADLQQAGLEPVTHQDGVINTDTGRTKVTFKAERQVEVKHELHSNTMTAADLKNHVIHYEDGGQVVLDVKLPEKGDYALNVFTRDEGTHSEFQNVCSYLVTAEAPAPDSTPFPALPEGQVGATPANAAAGLVALSHKTPVVEWRRAAELDLAFRMEHPLDVESGLQLQLSDAAEEQVEYALSTVTGDKLKVRVRLPEPGTYKLQINAKDKENGKDFENVFNYIIRAGVATEKCLPFPHTHALWRTGCDVKEPLGGMLESESEARFRLRVAGARRVVVMGPEGVVELEAQKDGIWNGVCTTGEPGSEVKVCVEMEGEEELEDLLTYKVRLAEDIRMYAWKRLDHLKHKRERERRAATDGDFMACKKALEEAVVAKDRAGLQAALEEVTRIGAESRLPELVPEARRLLKTLDRIATQSVAILDMDQRAMQEVRGYINPPKLVHDVMVAALLLLGDNEDITWVWKECQRRCKTVGRNGLYHRVRNFDIAKLHPEIAARARQLLQLHQLDEVRDASAGAGTFYVWSDEQIKGLHELTPDAAEATPADADRQVKLFREARLQRH